MYAGRHGVGDGGGRVSRSPIRVRHLEAAPAAERAMPDVVGRAECGAVVPRRGLDVDLLEWGLGPNLPIRDAVHGTAAREAQARILRALPQSEEHVHGALFVHRLQ